MAQNKSTSKKSASRGRSTNKKVTRWQRFKRSLRKSSTRSKVVALVVILLIGGLGTWKLTTSNAGTFDIDQGQCALRGREWSPRDSYCASVCQPGAGGWIKNRDQYGYCANAVSEVIGQDKCSSLGRRYVGAVGCARRWQQTKLAGAMQCITGSDTYYVANPYDYCDNQAVGNWVWPLPATHRVATGWGVETSKGIHKGIDIGDHGGNLGAHVVAAHAGTVTQSYDSGACGYFMVIKAANTPYWQGYQHLEVGSAQVSVGEYVHAGEYIARVGRAGGSTCGTAGFYHLHFSVEKGNWISFYSSPLSHSINPLSVLPN